MDQQINQTMPAANGELRFPTGAAGTNQLPADLGPRADWIYGNPNLTYNGQGSIFGVDEDRMEDIIGMTTSPEGMPTGGGAFTMPPAMGGGWNTGGLPSGGGAFTMPPAMGGGWNTGGLPSGGFAQGQRMQNPLDMAATSSTDGRESYQASLRGLLARNVGYFVVATFLVGSEDTVTWQGILHTVGSDYLVLYQPDYERYISCDLYALKFVQFHNVKGVPYCAGARAWEARKGL